MHSRANKQPLVPVWPRDRNFACPFPRAGINKLQNEMFLAVQHNPLNLIAAALQKGEWEGSPYVWVDPEEPSLGLLCHVFQWAFLPEKSCLPLDLLPESPGLFPLEVNCRAGVFHEALAVSWVVPTAGFSCCASDSAGFAQQGVVVLMGLRSVWKREEHGVGPS